MRIQKERLDALIKAFNGSPIKKTFGMTFSYTKNGEAVFEMPHHPGFEHGLGDIHGGVIATLLDNAGWFTVAPHYDRWVATVEMQVRLHEPSHREALRAIGKLVRAGKHIAVAEMAVRTPSDRLIATGSGTFAVTSQELPP